MAFVIGDIAGRYDSLMRLVAKIPQGKEIILVGDLVDRGPQSRQVVEWAMKNATALKGNHEDMMVDFLRGRNVYNEGIWFANGGAHTLNSYDIPMDADIYDLKVVLKYVPEEQIAWMDALPTFIDRDGLFITHAPVSQFHQLDITKSLPLSNQSSLVWNRSFPEPMEGKLQLFGHNANWGLRKFGSEESPWAICLDDSWQKELTAYDTETKQIIQEPYSVE